MNILFADSLSVLSDNQTRVMKERLVFTMARFCHRVNGVTLHVSADGQERFHCAIHANVEGVGIVNVLKDGDDAVDTVNQAISSIEHKMAPFFRSNRWYQFPTFSAWAGTVRNTWLRPGFQ